MGDLLRRFVRGVAVAYYASAWADNAETNGPPYPPGCELTDEAGEPPPDWVDWAMRVAGALAYSAGCNVHAIVQRALDTNDTPRDTGAFIEDLGFCLAMQVMGHGVRWSDDHPDLGLVLPYISSPEAAWDADGRYVDGSLYGAV